VTPRIALVSREIYPYVGGGIAPIVAAAAQRLSAVAEVTVVTSSAHRDQHLTEGGNTQGIRFVFVDEPTDDEVAGWFSYLHRWSANVYAALRDAYPGRGPDLIEFCDYLAEGFVAIQAKHTRDPWFDDTLVCVRLHTTSEIVSVLDGHLPDDFATVSIHEAERYCLRQADRLLWSGGDVLATYQRFYGADALAPGILLPPTRRVPAGGNSRRCCWCRSERGGAATAAVPRPDGAPEGRPQPGSGDHGVAAG
jgi:glycogen synthase